MRANVLMSFKKKRKKKQKKKVRRCFSNSFAVSNDDWDFELQFLKNKDKRIPQREKKITNGPLTLNFFGILI